jgi:ribosomal protein S18 acetylase RimI-like enzyme
MAVDIRAAMRDDASAIAEVHVASWRSAYRGLIDDAYLDALTPAHRLEMWSSWFESRDPDLLLLVGLAEGEIVGFLEGGRAESEGDACAEIQALYVLPAWTGSGIGSGLLDAAVRSFRSSGFARAVLWVLSTNTGVRRFYERAGWRADGIEDTYEIDGVRYPTMRYATEF